MKIRIPVLILVFPTRVHARIRDFTVMDVMLITYRRQIILILILALVVVSR